MLNSPKEEDEEESDEAIIVLEKIRLVPILSSAPSRLSSLKSETSSFARFSDSDILFTFAAILFKNAPLTEGVLLRFEEVFALALVLDLIRERADDGMVT